MLSERSKLEHADSPEDQCSTETPTGQCPFARVEGSDHCSRHGAYAQLAQTEKINLYNFQKSQFLGQSVEDQKKFKEAKYDLSAELGVCRTILQKYLDQVTSFQDLQMHNMRILPMMDRIHKISESVLKADQKLATLMSEEDAFNIAQGLLDAVHKLLQEYIDDDKEFASAMESIGEAFNKVINKDAESKE